MSFLPKNYYKLIFGWQFLKIYCRPGQQLPLRGLRTTAVNFDPNKQNPNALKHGDTSNAAKKQKEAIKITLIQNQNVTVTALEDAKNLAKRRSMHLVKVQDIDPKSQRPVYKILTAAEMLENELSDTTKSNNSTASAKKPEKSLSIGSRIAEHDLCSRLKNITKWLNKQHEVRILIQATSEKDLVNGEKIFKTIEETIKTPQIIGKIVQKRTNGNIIKFNILPVKPATNDKATDNSQ